MKYDVFITQDGDWYIADVPALPGCMSQGRTEKEVLVNVRDAIRGYLEVLKEQNREAPKTKRVKVAASG
jgi:predicted RNase H-like HicB family nuclease